MSTFAFFLIRVCCLAQGLGEGMCSAGHSTPLFGGTFAIVVVQAEMSHRVSQRGWGRGRRGAPGSHLEVEAKQMAPGWAGLQQVGSAAARGDSSFTCSAGTVHVPGHHPPPFPGPVHSRLAG